MTITFVRTDILNPYSREIVSTQSYATLIKFLIDKYPSGFEGPVDISVNAKVIAVEDYDIALNENDVIVLLDRTALPIGLIGGPIITALANLAISVAISFVANKLFAPDAVDESKNASAVYNVASGQNIARYGSPVPIVYGKIRMYPSLIVHPYKRYEDNIQYLYHVMCVSQGTCTTDEVLISEDQITSTDDLQWKLLYKDSFYDIPENAYGVHVTSTLSNPSNMEIEVNEDFSPAESEKYTIRAGAEFVEFDYIYPNGLIYYESDGETTAIRTEFVARIYTGDGAGNYSLQKEIPFYQNVSNVTPLRFTHREDVSIYGEAVYISFEKTLNASSSWYVTNTVIERVKEIYPNEDFTNLYCDKTLLACRIKATDAVSALGQVKVNAYFTRTDVGNMMDDVLRDIYTNTKYGAALSDSDLYFPGSEDRVDCVYEENMTVFDAMRKPAIAQGYSVFLAGQDVILKKDGVNNILSGMYNEQNISKGSVKSQYLFKEESPSYDGYEVHYILGDGWLPMVYTYPENSVRPQRIDLFGVVDWGGVAPVVCHSFDMTLTTPTQPQFDISGISYDLLNVVDNEDGTWHVWTDSPDLFEIKCDGNKEDITHAVICNAETITNMVSMFANCTALTTVKAYGDFSKVEVLSNFVKSCPALIWCDMGSVTTGSLTTMRDFSNYSANLQWIDFTGVDTSTCVGFMNNNFNGCTALVCMTNLDTTAADDKAGMFTGCTSLVQPDPTAQGELLSIGGSAWVNQFDCPQGG